MSYLFCVSYFIVFLCSTNELSQSLGRLGTPKSIQEDRTIEALVKKHGQKSWANIANQLFEMYGTQRSGKQCR